MAVHAFEEHSLAVYIKQVVFNLNVTETVLGRECHFVLALRIALHNVNGIKVRRFSSPELHIWHFKFSDNR